MYLMDKVPDIIKAYIGVKTKLTLKDEQDGVIGYRSGTGGRGYQNE